MKLKDIISRFENRIPLAWQESWDCSGLLLGSPERTVTNILFAYDVCLEVIEAAIKKRCQLIVTHHPFRMKAPVAIKTNTYEGRIIQACLKHDIALYSAHTNHDASPDSLNRSYLQQLGLTHIQVLAPVKTPLYKLIVMTPTKQATAVLEALFANGAGGIGNYSECSFRTSGIGTFKGNEASSPAIGKKNIRSAVAEEKLEVLLPAENLVTAINAMLKAHPYEEVAYDILPLVNQRKDIGLGAWGIHPSGLTPTELTATLKKVFNIKSLRWVSSKIKTLKRIGICTGSGTSLLPETFALGLDAFITGDVKYHQAIDAKRAGLAIADIGHFASEVAAVDALQSIFNEIFAKSLRTHAYHGLTDPFETR